MQQQQERPLADEVRSLVARFGAEAVAREVDVHVRRLRRDWAAGLPSSVVARIGAAAGAETAFAMAAVCRAWARPCAADAALWRLLHWRDFGALGTALDASSDRGEPARTVYMRRLAARAAWQRRTAPPVRRVIAQLHRSVLAGSSAMLPPADSGPTGGDCSGDTMIVGIGCADRAVLAAEVALRRDSEPHQIHPARTLVTLPGSCAQVAVDPATAAVAAIDHSGHAVVAASTTPAAAAPVIAWSGARGVRHLTWLARSRSTPSQSAAPNSEQAPDCNTGQSTPHPTTTGTLITTTSSLIAVDTARGRLVRLHAPSAANHMSRRESTWVDVEEVDLDNAVHEAVGARGLPLLCADSPGAAHIGSDPPPSLQAELLEQCTCLLAQPVGGSEAFPRDAWRVFAGTRGGNLIVVTLVGNPPVQCGPARHHAEVRDALDGFPEILALAADPWRGAIVALARPLALASASRVVRVSTAWLGAAAPGHPGHTSPARCTVEVLTLDNDGPAGAVAVDAAHIYVGTGSEVRAIVATPGAGLQRGGEHQRVMCGDRVVHIGPCASSGGVVIVDAGGGVQEVGGWWRRQRT
jgi:hypothetical protein